MADLIKQIKGTNGTTYDLQDKVSTFGGTNLFINTGMSTGLTNFVSNSSTDWTKYFRYYNGATSNHSFSQISGSEWQDTITLNNASNLGICFVRSATDIKLNPNSYYTMSCEAKCSATGYNIALGLSYYNTSNNWVWRGGSNTRAFSATNTWQKFSLTFKPDSDTQYICYCFTVYGKASGTDTWTIKRCKLEKGNKPTEWTPAPQDLVIYASDTIEFFQ